MTRVLLIGVDPKLIDFTKVSGVDAEQVKAAAARSDKAMRDLGFEQVNCTIDLGETAEATLTDAIAQGPFECVMIGAGVRVLPEHTVLFENVINIVHRELPTTRFAFNTSPDNTPDAILRVTGER
jgi:hypothetical protein